MNSFLDNMVKLVKEVQAEQEDSGDPETIARDKYNEMSISHNNKSSEQERIWIDQKKIPGI